jgi:chromosome segregation ATPase
MKNTSNTNQLEDIISSRKKLIKKIILSQQQNKNHIDSIEKILSAIKKLENEANITELNKQVMQIRYDNCLYQQKNPKIKKYLQEINLLEQSIRDMTKPERKAINKLSIEMEKSGSTDNTQKQINRLQKRMRQKTHAQVRKISQLNNEIYRIMQDKIQEARPIAQQLAEKYKKINTQVKNLNGKLEQHVNAINSLVGNNETLRTARQQLTRARKKLLKINPCSEPELNPTWESLFV